MAPNKPCKSIGCAKQRYANISWCFSHYRLREKSKREEKMANRLLRKRSSKKFQRREKKKWHAKTWKLFSEYIRRKGADFAGYVSCYTCDERHHWKEMNAGHWRHGKLDFDVRNVRAQCPKCNLYLSGRLDRYTVRLMQENGLEWMERLGRDADGHTGYSLDEMMAIHAALVIELESPAD